MFLTLQREEYSWKTRGYSRVIPTCLFFYFNELPEKLYAGPTALAGEKRGNVVQFVARTFGSSKVVALLKNRTEFGDATERSAAGRLAGNPMPLALIIL